MGNANKDERQYFIIIGDKVENTDDLLLVTDDSDSNGCKHNRGKFSMVTTHLACGITEEVLPIERLTRVAFRTRDGKHSVGVLVNREVYQDIHGRVEARRLAAEAKKAQTLEEERLKKLQHEETARRTQEEARRKQRLIDEATIREFGKLYDLLTLRR